MTMKDFHDHLREVVEAFDPGIGPDGSVLGSINSETDEIMVGGAAD